MYFFFIFEKKFEMKKDAILYQTLSYDFNEVSFAHLILCKIIIDNCNNLKALHKKVKKYWADIVI